MKRLTMISMAALLLLAVSCKKDKEQQIDGSGFGFRATVESHEGDSKTHLDGKAVKWDSNDKILVQSHTCAAGKRFAFVQIEEGGEAGFNPAETLPGNFYSPNYTAVYPAGDFTFGESIINIELPSTQTYVENSFGNGANPMIAACGDNKKLAFKNICGLLKLQLKSQTACKITSITLKANEENKENELLCGTGTVAYNGGNPTLNLTSGGGSLTLDCGSGVQMSAGDTTNFYFVVPAGTLAGGFTVKVTNEKGWTWEQVAPANENNGIQRNHITAMPVIEMSFLPDGALPGLFSVAPGKQVRFSKGNLVAAVDAGGSPTAWKFAAHQYEYLGEGGANFTIGSVAGDVDLFCYSTDLPNNWGIYEKYSGGLDSHWKGDFKEWGEKFPDDNGCWRTLGGYNNSKGIGGEWDYLMNQRVGLTFGSNTNSSYRYARVKVNDKDGYIVIPDEFTWPSEAGTQPTTFNKSSDVYGNYTDVQFGALEKAGVVFLPAAGARRDKTSSCPEGYIEGLYYRSCEYMDSAKSYALTKDSNGVKISVLARYYAASVRLVYEENSSSR